MCDRPVNSAHLMIPPSNFTRLSYFKLNMLLLKQKNVIKICGSNFSNVNIHCFSLSSTIIN